MDEDHLTPDVCIIGAGSGGLSVAAAVAAFGVETVLIERGPMGGDCLNVGCVPSKSLIAAARHAQAIREAPRFGIHAGVPDIRFGEVRDRIRSVIAGIAPHDSVERFEGLGVRVIQAEARFTGPRTVAAGTARIRARRFVIATGSRPRIPEIPGLGTVSFLTNETVFDLVEAPRHLVVIGGGPIGVELAQAFRRLGSDVTLVQSRTILPADDPELVAVVRRALIEEGVVVEEGVAVSRVEAIAGGAAVFLSGRGAQGEAERRLEASHLLVAVGRVPTLDGLDLEAAGIRTKDGRLEVGEDLRTTNARVFAVGDAANGPIFTHAAGYEAGLVARALLFRLPVRRGASPLPRATFTDPPLAQIGLTESEAAGRPGIRILRFPVAMLDRAATDGRPEGLLKLVVGRRGRILGAGFVGPAADETMNLFALALSQRMTLRDLTGFVSPYPTIGEIAKRAAGEAFRPLAERPLVRFIVRLLARLG